MECLILNAENEGSSIDQVKGTMTVGELIEYLSEYNENSPMYLSFDNGYTYGGIMTYHFETQEASNDDSDSLDDNSSPAEYLILKTERQGYSPDQIIRTMTVGGFIEFLDNYDEAIPVYLSFDNSSSYGGIDSYDFETQDDSSGDDSDDFIMNPF